MGIAHKLYFSPRPLFSYTRHILVTKGLGDEYDFIVEFLESLSGNPSWRKSLAKYGVGPAFPAATPSVEADRALQ